MKRLLILLVGLACLVACGCEAVTRGEDYRDEVAVDLAVATIISSPTPTPPGPAQCPRCHGTGWIKHGDGHRTPCPDCQQGSAGPFGGPLDTLRDAKELIAKGNELADRGKAILDQAERDGKITVDIRVPKPVVNSALPPGSCRSCQGGACPLALRPSSQAPSMDETLFDPSGCESGACRPGLSGRRRR